MVQILKNANTRRAFFLIISHNLPKRKHTLACNDNSNIVINNNFMMVFFKFEQPNLSFD